MMSNKRYKKIEEEILELLAGGALITETCRELDITPATLNRWRRSDEAFDDRCWSAEGQGIMIQRATLIEDMHEAIKTTGPGSATRIQGLHNLLHEVGRTAGKLVSRMNDRVRVSADVTHVIVGWESDGDIIDALPADSLLSNQVNGRQHLDHPREPHADSEEATVSGDHVDG
jgi:hypothetical protein